MNITNQFYPLINEEQYDNSIASKHEFSENESHKKKGYLYQEPTQLLLRNYLSGSTIYENVLLYHSLGTGKTCAAITIVEGLKEYIYNMGRRIVVLVKNKNIQRNFMNEIASKCTGEAYITEEEKEMSMINTIERKDVALRLQRDISKYYKFITYGTFVNRVLGAKEFEKDELGRNTTRAKRENGRVKRKPVKDQILNLNNTVVVVDEAHNVTNNDVYMALQKVLSNSYNTRVILLTATPMYDNPREMFEIANLLNHSSPDLQLPIRNELLKSPYVFRDTSKYINNNVLKGGIIRLTKEGSEALYNALKGKVSYLKGNVENMPMTIEKGNHVIPSRIGSIKVIRCEMSDYQYNVYQNALISDVKRFQNTDLALSIQNLEAVENSHEGSIQTSTTSSLYKNSSDASTMVYPNNQYGKIGFESTKTSADKKEVFSNNLSLYSCKLNAILDNINRSKGPVFVYSNYVTAGGTSLIKQVLLHNGYKEYKTRNVNNHKPGKMFIVYDDSMSLETREKLRKKFNSPDNKYGDIIKVLIGSPVISEGITLKNVRQVHLLEPAWNMSRVNQIIGRAIRNYSHIDLPKEERYVDVFKYIAVYKETPQKKSTNIKDFFIDKEKYILSEEKDRANKLVERFLKVISFDCHLNRIRNNTNSTSIDGTSECDYNSCTFTCSASSDESRIDKSTYNLHITSFGSFDIEFVSNCIKEMFKKSFVWSLPDIIRYVTDIEKQVSKEVIYATLSNFVDSKLTLEDMYGREGFIIQRGLYYIFNANDIDISSTFFSKYLDFTVNRNKYSLNEYLVNKHGIQENSTENTVSENTIDSTPLSQTDVQYNNKIVQTYDVFGTYRKRSTGNEPYGPIDGKFKIVDLRSKHLSNKDDKRKTITGMFIKSFKKAQLEEIARYLNIKTTQPIDQFGKDRLAEMIENNLIQSGKVLR